MTNEQWQALLDVVDGRLFVPTPVGFIIDSPWLPGWAGMSIMDYFTSESQWLEANLKAVRRFPQITFLPGFWSEYGMCTEPSAFGSRCTWAEDEFPFAHPVATTIEAAAAVPRPDPRKDGLPPFVLKRLQHCQAAITQEGHAIRFAVARGPWNIAAFLMGTTEFLIALVENPDATHKLLGTITDFLVDWLQLQAETFPTIGGIMILDDIIGFVGEEELVEAGLPYLKKVFSAFDAHVRFFHNDAKGLVCAPHLPEIGVNLFNYSFEHSIAEMQQLTKGKVTLLGNIPPRDVLAAGKPEDVDRAVRAALESVGDSRRVILSAGGGMPMGVATQNIEAFLVAAGYHKQ